ncbi:MAG: type 4a pilus biogenesis protein PilO [Candidatus Spechtbacterales bacterium]
MKKNKNKLFTALGVFAGVVVLCIFVLWQFLLSGLHATQGDYVANSRALSEVEQKADLKNDLAKEIEKINSDIETVKGLLLTEGDKLEFIQEIEGIALANGNTYSVRSTNEIKDSKTGKVVEIDFSVNLQGTFAGVFGFFEGLKSTPYLISIKQVSMSKEGDGGLISTNVVLKIYLQ